MGRKRTPQEKKALSYTHDCRSDYGENSKSSRKAVPLHKRLVNRANRQRRRRLLDDALGVPDLDRAEVAEQRAAGFRAKTWRKVPDAPLGVKLAARAAGRRFGDRVGSR